MQNEHRIARVIWQTDMTERSQVHAMQNQCSRFSTQILPAILVDVLQAFCGDYDYYQIEQIELDLGQIPAELFWQEVPRRLRQQLQAWLQRWQQQQTTSLQLTGTARPVSARQRELASLAWYLRYASYPWWHQQGQAGDLMQYCLQGQAQALREMLVELGQQSTVRWRLVLHFYRDLKAILGLLEAAQAAWLSEYVEHLVGWQKQYLLVQVSDDEFAQKLWFVILTQLIVERGSVFNQASFLQTNLQLLAQQLGCSYWQLLAALGQILALIEKRGHSTNRWFSTLRYLQGQYLKGESAAALKSANRRALPNADEHVFSWQQVQKNWHYLRAHGKHAGQNWHIAQLLLWAAQQDSLKLAQLLRRTSRVEMASQFLIAHLNKNQLLQLLPVLAPGDYPFIQLHLQQQTQMAKQQNWREESAWEVVLGYLLSSSASYFNRRQFVALSLHKAARLYAVDMLWLLNWMLLSLQKLQPVGHRFEVLIICRELHQQQQRLARQPPARAALAGSAYRHGIASNQHAPALHVPATLHSANLAELTAWPRCQREWQALSSEQVQHLLKRYIEQLRPGLIKADTRLAQQMQVYFAGIGKANAHLIWRYQFAKALPQFTDLLDQLTQLARELQAQAGLYRYWRKHYPDISSIKASLSQFALSYRQAHAVANANHPRQLMAEISRAVFAAAPGRIAWRSDAEAQRTYPEFFQTLRAMPWFAAVRTYLQLSDARLAWPGSTRAQVSALARAALGARPAQLRRVEPGGANLTPMPGTKLALPLLKATAASASRLVPWSVFFAHCPTSRYLLNYSAALNEAQIRHQLARWPASLAFFELVLSQRLQAKPASVLSPRRHALQTKAQHNNSALAQRRQARIAATLEYRQELSLFRALQLPPLISRLKERLQCLLLLLQSTPGVAVVPGNWPAILRETSVAMVLDYRYKNPDELVFYRRLLQILALDYALDLQACQAALHQHALARGDTFWCQVLNTPAAKHYAGSKTQQAIMASLSNLPPQFDLQQDYRGEYLHQPLSAAVIHYWLEHRRLPPGLRQAASWSLARFWDDAISQNYPVRKLVLQHSRVDEEKLGRIAGFLNPEQVQKLLVSSSGISREQARALQLWQQHLVRLGLPETDKVALQYLWHRDLIRAWWRGDNQGFSAERLMMRLAQYLQSKSSRQRLQLQTGLQRLASVLPGNWRIALQLVLQRTRLDRPSVRNRSDGRNQRDTPDTPGLAARTERQRATAPDLASARYLANAKPVQTESVAEAVSKQETADLSLPVLIKNGGLVLLQGFYGALFQRLNYTDGEQFLNPESQQRAALLLHYLSTGKSQADEAELVLNKLMTGLTPSMNLPAAIELDELEVDMCNSLLHSAIDYWSAIGRSTVDGFRGNWLIRNASLSDAGDHWRLLVEKRAYDILLGRSPFSYSVVRLPWMSKAIYVTWPT